MEVSKQLRTKTLKLKEQKAKTEMERKKNSIQAFPAKTKDIFVMQTGMVQKGNPYEQSKQLM